MKTTCDFGDCRATPHTTFDFKGMERRTFCATHSTDPCFQFARTDGKVVARFDEGGQRVTTCCGAYSTFCQDGSDGSEVQVCKNCYEEVPEGEGDGSQFRHGVTSEAYFEAAGLGNNAGLSGLKRAKLACDKLGSA